MASGRCWLQGLHFWLHPMITVHTPSGTIDAITARAEAAATIQLALRRNLQRSYIGSAAVVLAVVFTPEIRKALWGLHLIGWAIVFVLFIALGVAIRRQGGFEAMKALITRVAARCIETIDRNLPRWMNGPQQ